MIGELWESDPRTPFRKMPPRVMQCLSDIEILGLTRKTVTLRLTGYEERKGSPVLTYVMLEDRAHTDFDFRVPAENLHFLSECVNEQLLEVGGGYSVTMVKVNRLWYWVKIARA